MVSIFNKYPPLYYNEAIRKNLTARRMIKKTGRYSPTSMGSGHRKHEGGTDMNGIGIGIISLLVYIAAILVINMVLKRKMAEAMMWSFLIILAMGGIFAGQNVFTLAQTGIKAAAKQEVVYASMAFVFMAFMMDKTGVIGRLVEILNSVLGAFRAVPDMYPPSQAHCSAWFPDLVPVTRLRLVLSRSRG